MRSIAVVLAVGAVFLGAATYLDFRIVGEVTSRPFDVLRVPSGKSARLASLGHRTFLSDLYWLSAVQYIGDPRADERGWDKLFPLIDLVTDLDPRHGYAYQTAGIVLSAAGRLDESDAILQKGIDHGPPWWTFPYYVAFNYWFYRGDYATAARYAEIAARRPDASPNISHLAVSLASKSGTPEDAITLIEELKATVKDEVSAQRLEDQLKLAIVERDAQALERAAARFRDEHGHPISSLRDLTAAGVVRAVPPDPFGGEYVWDAAEGQVHSSVNPFRFHVRTGAHRPRFEYQAPGAPPSGVLR